MNIYTITGDGVLSVYDTSDPENVTITWSESIGPDDIDYPDIQGYGDLLVINRGNSVLEGWSIANRCEPVLAWSEETAACRFTISGEYLYKFVLNTLIIYSLEDLNPPEEISNSHIYLVCTRSPRICGDYLYVPSSYGVVKVNVSDPLTPRNESLLPSGPEYSRGVRIQFPFAFTLHERGMQAFDIWDPLHPQLVGSGWFYQLPTNFTIENNVIIVATSVSLQCRTVDIPNPIDRHNTEVIPSEYSLLQAYPNPFNGTVNLTVMLQERSDVLMQIYSIEGRLITTLVNHTIEKGNHRVTWTPDNCSSGVYFVSLKTNETSAIQKIIYTR